MFCVRNLCPTMLFLQVIALPSQTVAYKHQITDTSAVAVADVLLCRGKSPLQFYSLSKQASLLHYIILC